MDNIKTWTGIPVYDGGQRYRPKWRKYVHGVATLGSRTPKEQNRFQDHILS